MSGCPICESPYATVATLFYPREEGSNSDVSVIVNCPSCGTLIDGEVQEAIDSLSLPVVPLVDTEEEVVSCPI